MVNHCITVGLDRNITSRFRLSNEVYHELNMCGLHTWYLLSSIEVAASILKNYRKTKKGKRSVKTPRAKKLMAKLGNQAYKIIDNQLRIPINPRQYFYVKLHKRALEFLSDATLKLGSATLTASKVVLTFVKTAEVVESKGYVAIDVNEDNVTSVDISGEVKFHSLLRLKDGSYGYMWRRKKLQQKHCEDRRILEKALSKLSKNHCNKVSTMLHQTSTAIINDCKAKGYGLIHEDLKGIRKSTNKKIKRFNSFNGKIRLVSRLSKKLKRRLNNWWFGKFLSQLVYKSAWEGVKVIESKYTKGSSSTCPICGFKPLAKYPNGHVECKKCGCVGNRHIIACINLIKWELAVQAQPPCICSDAPRPNKAQADEEKRGKQKHGSCVTRIQHSKATHLTITHHSKTQQNHLHKWSPCYSAN